MTETLKPITPQELGAILATIEPGDSILEMTNLNGFPLSDMHVSTVRLTGSSFQGADLSRSIIVDGHGSECNFASANMTNTLFYRCRLTSRCNFSGATMDNTRFIDCVLAGADFRGADLTTVAFIECDLSSSIYDNSTIFADDFNADIHGMELV